ncbi:MAG TPA: protein kinase [Terriglobia bacterium]|nr:protein kinase [Terriglobia bacterium]
MSRFEIDAESWTVLSRALDQALELPLEERSAWLENLSPEFAGLKAHLRDLLLRTHSLSEDSWTIPKLQLPDTGPYEALPQADEHPGDLVGAYRLVRLLAAGGMGTVWLAERSDGLMNRMVALKLPRGAWRARMLAERMARERKILASLNHPNIARLYDAGLRADGQPYLALEYVEGCRIDQYCQQKRVNVRERLRLFLQVTVAVAHAHAHLVVHRDLKPANILVTEDGQVRLLDFGIAKLLEQETAEATELTQLGGHALTPAYASPEQISAAPLGISSDVYSLGVVLYELLTDRLPYRPARESRAALEEAVLHGEPARASEMCADAATRGALRGDLDVILLKALKKKPEERYLTVDALTDDIERYLEGLPVQAQPDRWTYRAGKFASRHRVAVGAATVAIFAIVLGLGAALWQARVARAEKATAEDVKDFVTSVFRNADPYAGTGKVLSAQDLLMEAKSKVDRLDSARTELRVELLNLIGESLISLDNFDSAETVARQAVEEGDRSLPPDHPEGLRSHLLMAEVHQFRGRSAEMKHEIDLVMPPLRRNPDANKLNLILALKTQASWAIDSGHYLEAKSAAQEAFALAQRDLGRGDPTTIDCASMMAMSLMYGGAPPEAALVPAEQAFRMASELYGDRPRHPRMIDARGAYGRALAEAGHLKEGIEQLQQDTDDAAAVFGENSTMLAFGLDSLARFQHRGGELKSAIANENRALAIHARTVQHDSYTYASSLLIRGGTLVTARRPQNALRDLSEAYDVFQRTMGANSEAALVAQYCRAHAMAYLGRIAEAKEMLKPVLEQYRSTYRDANFRPYLPLHVLGIVYRFGGDYESALQTQQQALTMIPDGPIADVGRMPIVAELGLAQVELGRYDEAGKWLEQANTLFRKVQLQMTPHQAEVLVGLGRVHLSLGNATQAQSFFAAANSFWREFDPASRWAGEALLWSGRCQKQLGREEEAAKSLAAAEKILARSPIPSDARLLADVRE